MGGIQGLHTLNPNPNKGCKTWGEQVWIDKGKRAEDEMYRAMWERAMDEMLERLLFTNQETGYTYVAEFARRAGNIRNWLLNFMPNNGLLGSSIRACRTHHPRRPWLLIHAPRPVRLNTPVTTLGYARRQRVSEISAGSLVCYQATC